MCGRFTLKTPVADWLANLFPNWNLDPVSAFKDIAPSLTQPRFNIAPSQQILVLRYNDNGEPTIDSMRWGLVPNWADSLSIGYNMINARSESIADKPSFRPSLISQRCVVMADGYYEWKKLSPKVKEPFWIHTAGERVFAMAGLWAENRKIQAPRLTDHAIMSATIITTESSEDVVSVHDRMPALMLNEAQIAAWLEPSLNKPDNIDRLLEQLQPTSTGILQLRRVSTRVNSPANEYSQVLDPVL